jgi:diguanylate cyclase (GGDEF)-like protein
MPTKGELAVLMKLAKELLQVDCVDAALQALWRGLQPLDPDDLLLTACCDSGEYRFRLNASGAITRLDEKTRRLLDAVAGPEFSSDKPSQLIELKDGFLIATSFACGNMSGRVALSWQDPPDRLHHIAKLLPALADLAGARLASLMNQSRREQQLSAQCNLLVATQTRHKEELRTSELENVEARALAAVDQLTGLQNRRGFIAKAEQCLLIAQRQELACAVIFADVDGLKGVNDQLGHAAGDALICCAAGIFRSALRSADVVARVGGDEFAAFTFDNATPTAIIDRINRKIAEFNAAMQYPFFLSLSVGVVICDTRSKQSLSDYLERADNEMYRQKSDRQVARPD